MRFALLTFALAVSGLFYCAVPLLYLFPRLAENRIVGTIMFFTALLVVAPTWATLFVQLCRSGLKTAGGAYRAKGG